MGGAKVESELGRINMENKGSNCAATEAAGYVLGMTGIQPKLKPESWAASFGADAVVNGRSSDPVEVAT